MNDIPLSHSSQVHRSDSCIEAEVDNEIVALNIETGTYYGLNRVGSHIWRLLAEPICISDLCTKLTTEYAVDAEVCERQVLDLLEALRAEGLIKTPALGSASASSSPQPQSPDEKGSDLPSP
jgi:hypothetical protein